MTLDTQTLLTLIATFVGGGVAVSLAANLLKKLFGLNSKAVIHTMVVVIAFVAGVAQYIIQNHATLPPVVLGISTPAIYGISQLVFKYAVYASQFMGKVRVFNEAQASAKTADAQVAAIDPPAALSEDNNQFIETGSSGLPTNGSYVASITDSALDVPVGEFQA